MIKLSYKNLKWIKRFSYLKNILFDEKSLNQEGAKFQIIRFLPHSRIGPHYHQKVTEIFYIRKGKGKFIFNGISHNGLKDDIFLCQPHDVHEVVNSSDEELIILIFKTNEDPSDIYWK